ncbi:MAG: cysteine desulfurase family protein [Desulfovibrionales bacterium]
MKPLYFDYNATTPVLPRVARAITPWLTNHFGNPGSDHLWGLTARQGVDEARVAVAALVNCLPEEIIFTSCATESNNLALFGSLTPGDHVITSAVEHPAVLEPLKIYEKEHGEVTILPVDTHGLVSPDDAARAVTAQTKLVTIMLANNETGVIQPVQQIAAAVRACKPDLLVHTDAAQAVGKIQVDVNELGVDLLTIAGHKLYAPKGIGALVVRRGVRLVPRLFGGGQEGGIRPGTENVPYMAGLAEACRLAHDDLEEEFIRQQRLGAVLARSIEECGVKFRIHGSGAPRLPNTMSVGFQNLRAGDIISGLVGLDVGVSAGAACHGLHVGTMSHVLEAMNTDPAYGLGTIRISWGRPTSENDVRELADRLKQVLKPLHP